MTPRILICAHTQEQFDLACRMVPFMRAARRHNLVKRIWSEADVRGNAHCVYLYVLPGYEQSLLDHAQIVAYWKHVHNVVVELTDLQVLGDEPCELEADSPMQIQLAEDLLQIKRAGRMPLEYPRVPHIEESEFQHQVRKGLLS